IDDDTIVEIRVPERGNALYLLEEGAELLDEDLLRGYLLALGGHTLVAKLARQRFEPSLFVLKFGRCIIVLDAEKCILSECVNVEPDGVACRGRRELPVNRRLTTALRVHLDVQREELFGEPAAEVLLYIDVNAPGYCASTSRKVVGVTFVV